MLRKIVGIATFIAFLSMTSIASLLLSQGQLAFSGPLAQAAMANLSILVVLSGLHLTETHCDSTKITKMSIWTIGFVLLVYGPLVSFDVVSVQEHWNYLIALAILFITIIELQLLNWEKRKGLLKVIGMLLILSNAFLIIFFFTQLTMRSLAMVFDLAVITSVFAFLIGLILSRKKRVKVAPETPNS